MPSIQYPRVPGHEVIGIVDALGSGVPRLKVGQKVGVGWHGGNCGYCDACRRGYIFACESFTEITGITCDGGYAEYLLARAEAVAAVPAELPAIDAAPLMCAGVTTYNSLRNCGARPGDLVAVLGLGGLGHLGVQYAAKAGYRTVAIARGQEKKALALELGAQVYIDSRAQDPAKELLALGGARIVLATVTDGDAMNAAAGGLGPDGALYVLGAPPTLTVSPFHLISGRRKVQGWYSGTSIDSEDTLKFSAMAGVRSRNEIFPFERAAEAYERMIGGHARFRVVLKIGD